LNLETTAKQKVIGTVSHSRELALQY